MEKLKLLSKKDKIRYGSKAANLGEAIRTGFPVPEGYAIPVEALEDYLLHNGLHVAPEDILAKADVLREQLTNGLFSPAFRRKLYEVIEELKQNTGSGSYVVRSSSLLEDGENYSMAGMFESYIDLSTMEEVERAIKQCWAALYSDKVLDYLYENGIDFTKLKMGIVLQEFILGRPSGVMFTADPVTGDRKTIQINAVNGICADFETNCLPSAHYSMNKDNKLIHESLLPENAPVLEEDSLHKLHRAAIRLEEIFDGPMDVEWTYRNEEVTILQVRPITTISNRAFQVQWASPEQEQYTWFCVFPSPATPLMQDILFLEFEQLGAGAYETLFRTDTYAEMMIQEGYAYARTLPIEQEAERREKYRKDLLQLGDQGLCIYHDYILPQLLPLINQMQAYAGRELTKEEAVAYLQLSLDYLKVSWRQHWPAVQANEFLYQYEEEFLKEHAKLGLQDFYDLIWGYTLLTRDRELLFSMSGLIRKSTSLMELFRTCPYDTIVYAKLIKHPEASEVVRLINTYIAEYGACDSGEDTILHPVVMERPDYVISGIRKVLSMDESVFFDNLQKAKLRKEELKQELLSGLEAADQEKFLLKLSVAEKAFLSNDNHNYYMERMYRGHLRLASMEIGRILCREGVLDKPEDTEFLHIQELIDLLAGGSMEKNTVALRKILYSEQKKLHPPQMIGTPINMGYGAGEAASTEAKEQERDDQEYQQVSNQELTTPCSGEAVTLKGISGLRKTVRGTVQVGMTEVLQEDLILVLPHTHCGDIMPLIKNIKGLIYNWGSPYDHPGIIARELNIPAIYKTGNATELLKTGDLVELNGFTGVVTIVSNAFR